MLACVCAQAKITQEKLEKHLDNFFTGGKDEATECAWDTTVEFGINTGQWRGLGGGGLWSWLCFCLFLFVFCIILELCFCFLSFVRK